MILLCLFSSCEKKEDALVLPPPTGASHAMVNMGENYDKQVYFDFETGSAVFTSQLLSWDIAFEASPDGRHIFLNGGKNVLVYNTHSTSMNQLTDIPAGLSSSGYGWDIDSPGGQPTATGIGDWFDSKGATKGEVYLLQTAPDEFRKMRILAANSSSYTIEWAALNATGTPLQIILPKDIAYNFVHFSFSTGLVHPEPPKAAWDVVFTYYKDLVFNSAPGINDYVPYRVSGVLLNPANTSAATDDTHDFTAITLSTAQSLPFITRRNIIGYDWKDINSRSSTGTYTVNRSKNYILHTRKDQLYKLHFLDFYDSAGIKGHPSFEYERLK